jgi:putative ATPase
MNNLFQYEKGGDEPLALKLSPKTLNEFFGQEKIVAKDSMLRKSIEEDKILSCIFYGPSGTGKTALAKIIASSTRSELIRLNAVTARIEDLRTAMLQAVQNRLAGKRTILFIDEIHRFNKLQQEGLLPALEEGTVNLIGTTTKNPFFSLIPPLRSRVLLFEFEKLSSSELTNILKTAIKKEDISIEDKAKDYLIRFSNGDARRMLNLLEAVCIIETERNITAQSIEKLVKKQSLLYDRDENYHYDVISAFIKSIRGSNPDAALYWLALMLEAGEDPLFIARRLIILSSEDIGLADSFSLVLAESAYDAVDRIGMPEARIILAHITIYLSLQPKSNSSYRAIHKATEYVKTNEQLEVPPYLKSSRPAGKYYKYPHDYKYHYIKQDYLGSNLQFYEPDEQTLGHEKELKKRLEFFRRLDTNMER